MPEMEPVAELGAGFSEPGSSATEWERARRELQHAQLYWLTTVRPDGRPHVTPLLGIWFDGAMHFCTGPGERKAKNLVVNSQCVLTTGCNGLEGLDVAVEGDAVRVSDDSELAGIVDAYESKYGAHFTAPEGTWFGLGDAIRRGDVSVYRVAPTTVFGFHKGTPYSQTRWTFS